MIYHAALLSDSIILILLTLLVGMVCFMWSIR